MQKRLPLRKQLQLLRLSLVFCNETLRRADHVFDLIGKTPLVRISKVNPNPSVEICAKLEGFNPMDSVEDRIALSMINKAEATGKLTKRKIILEATSGNTGISATWVAALKGYKCVIVMPRTVSVERKKILKALGAKLVHAWLIGRKSAQKSSKLRKGMK